MDEGRELSTIRSTGNTYDKTHLSLQVDHVSFHFIVGLIEVVNLSVELLDVLIVVQN